jgi:hypothetical protein
VPVRQVMTHSRFQRARILWLSVLAIAIAIAHPTHGAADGGEDVGTPVDNIINWPDPISCDTDADCGWVEHCNGQAVCTFVTVGGGTICVWLLDALPNCDDGIACTIDSCEGPDFDKVCRSSAPDLDGDGHGDARCRDSDGTSQGDDCDDGNSDRFPGNYEHCDAVDQDCDPFSVGDADLDGDGAVSARCCNPFVFGTVCGDDCDDLARDVAPHLVDVCDGKDNDCSGTVDDYETCKPCGRRATLYPDADGDGFGDPNGAMSACGDTAGLSPRAGDCDDTEPSIQPGSQVCGAPGTVAICGSDGQSRVASCPALTLCRPQSDGTGICG